MQVHNLCTTSIATGEAKGNTRISGGEPLTHKSLVIATETDSVTTRKTKKGVVGISAPEAINKCRNPA